MTNWNGWIDTAEFYFEQGNEGAMWRCLLRAAARMDWLNQGELK